jgi:hypothetical protein
MAEAQVAYQALLEGLRSAEHCSYLADDFHSELCEDLAKAKREVEIAWLNETTRS